MPEVVPVYRGESRSFSAVSGHFCGWRRIGFSITVARMFDPVEKLKEFIRHPSISADSQARAGMKGAQEFVSGLLTSLGFTSEVVKTDLHPIIFAQRGGDASWPHVLIYGHYDVQPADPLNLWTTTPFEPTIRGNRIFGRGAARQKARS